MRVTGKEEKSGTEVRGGGREGMDLEKRKGPERKHAFEEKQSRKGNAAE